MIICLGNFTHLDGDGVAGLILDTYELPARAFLRAQPSLKWMAYNYDDWARETKTGFVSRA